MTSQYRVEPLEPGVWQITDVLDDRAYLVVGTKAAALVDTCAGYGDIAATAREITDLPMTVLLTHAHYDHVGGAYFFDEAYMAQEEDGRWDYERDLADTAYAKLVARGTFAEGEAFGPRDGTLPTVRHVEEGDLFDLGGLTVEAVALPGHTGGSMGYLVRERRMLLSGDAVTPIMCLMFAESRPISVYRKTLAKMSQLPFDRFYTGHHDVGFDRAELEGFDSCAEFAITDEGIPWQHALLPQFVGSVHLAPCETDDVDSPQFRALIGPVVPRLRRAGRRGRRRAAR